MSQYTCISIALVLFFLLVVFLRYAVKTVPENKRAVILRMGKSIGTRGPGLVVTIPVIDSAVWVDLQRTFHFKYNIVPTPDDRQISCSITLEGKIVDPEKSVMSVPDLEKALSDVIEAEIKVIAESWKSDELLSQKDWLAGQLQDAIFRSGRAWGFDVTSLVVEDFQIK
jgi:regulator of protease activity HflC (stomatin/prohibitin superfamily)